MGINNINYLIEPDLEYNHARQLELQSRMMGALIEAHKRGEHPWGEKRRDCPLCQEGK